MEAIIRAFIAELVPVADGLKTREWLQGLHSFNAGPTELIKQTSGSDEKLLQRTIWHRQLSLRWPFCLAEKDDECKSFERADRLPLSRMCKEAMVRADNTVEEFLRHVFESWVLAQAYLWSVGRGLADTPRAERTILRLKVILDEGGWTLAPGASRGSPPIDRR